MNSLGRWPIILPRIDVEAVEILDDEQRRVFQVLAIAEKLLAGFEEVRRLRLYSKASALDPAAAQRRGSGGGQQGAGGADLVCVPAGQTNNYWVVRFSFTTVFPGVGRRKVVLMDRQACGDFTKSI